MALFWPKLMQIKYLSIFVGEQLYNNKTWKYKISNKKKWIKYWTKGKQKSNVCLFLLGYFFKFSGADLWIVRSCFYQLYQGLISLFLPKLHTDRVVKYFCRITASSIMTTKRGNTKLKENKWMMYWTKGKQKSKVEVIIRICGSGYTISPDSIILPASARFLSSFVPGSGVLAWLVPGSGSLSWPMLGSGFPS